MGFHVSILGWTGLYSFYDIKHNFISPNFSEITDSKHQYFVTVLTVYHNNHIYPY